MKWHVLPHSLTKVGSDPTSVKDKSTFSIDRIEVAPYIVREADVTIRSFNSQGSPVGMPVYRANALRPAAPVSGFARQAWTNRHGGMLDSKESEAP